MPTYEFRCPNGHTFDEFHKISDAPSTATCPTCGAVAERAISGGAGLVFKGSGFYLTDYGKNAHRGGSTPAKSGESSGGGDASGGSKSSDGGSSGGSTPAPSSGSSSGSSSTESKSSGSKGDGGAKGAA
jgi:putative FmdB family regulatory protein